MKEPAIALTNDFGFTTLTSDEIRENVVATLDTSEIDRLNITVDILRQYVNQMHAEIMPLLANLRDTHQKDYIYWPNRKKTIEDKIKKLDELLKCST